MSRYWGRRARSGFVVDFVVDLPVPAGNIPVEGCPEPPLGGCASYCRVDYCSGEFQSVGSCRNFGNRDYFRSHDNSMVHRGRNPYSSGGDPDDSASARSCGVIDWGSKGARHDIGFPDCNTSCQRYPPCCNVAGFLPTAVSPLCSVGVAAHDWDEDQFGELWPCSFGSTCYIRTTLSYGPMNGKWCTVVVKDSQGRSAQIWRIPCIVALAGTAFPQSLVRQFEACPLRMNCYDVPYRAQERGQPLARWFVVKNP